jgi:hypothetical protein
VAILVQEEAWKEFLHCVDSFCAEVFSSRDTQFDSIAMRGTVEIPADLFAASQRSLFQNVESRFQL